MSREKPASTESVAGSAVAADAEGHGQPAAEQDQRRRR